MSHTIAEIARAIGARVEGNGDYAVSGAAEPAAATPSTLALAMHEKYAADLKAGAARVAVLWDGADWRELGLEAAIFVPRPRYAMAGITRALDPGPRIGPGIHPTAFVDPSAKLAPDAAIGPFAVVGPEVEAGPGLRLAAHATIAEGVRLGSDVLINSGVRLGARVKIGDRVILQPNAVIGADGFSFVTPEKSSVEEVRGSLSDRHSAALQSWTRIHSLGAVEIGDDVEVGANSTIDRGTIRDTRVGRGTKIDNLVQIGHNVRVGEDCLLCSLVGIAGSAQVGDRVVLAGQVGVNDNIFVGDDVVAGGASKIFTNVPKGRVILGYPAVKMNSHIEMYKALRRLPRLFRDVATLQKAVSNPDQTE